MSAGKLPRSRKNVILVLSTIIDDVPIDQQTELNIQFFFPKRGHKFKSNHANFLISLECKQLHW